MTHIRPALLFSLALSVLSGCSAVSAISNAGTEMDAYTLSAPAGGATRATGTRHLVVELPTSAGALASDRILIKPIPYQAQYLPGGRWSEPAPALVQTLLVATFQNMGGFRLVGRNGAGLMPDATLMTELQAFQAEPSGPAPAPITVRISVMMTLIGETDRRIIATRRFEATADVLSDDTGAIVAGFDRAMQTILREAVIWTVDQAG